MEFLKQRIFNRLGMKSVADFDAGPLQQTDAGAYLRNGIGPLREAPKEGPRWLFAAGQLAMTAHDLATWDLSVIKQTVLKPASYRAQQTTTLLANGTSTGYGLGINVSMVGGRRRLSHGGAVSGYTTTNQVYPDDRAAIVVFTNIYPGGAGASGQIASRIAGIIFSSSDTADVAARETAQKVYDGLAQGRHRPQPVYLECERLLHRPGAGGLRHESGALGGADRVHGDRQPTPRRTADPQLPDSGRFHHHGSHHDDSA